MTATPVELAVQLRLDAREATDRLRSALRATGRQLTLEAAPRRVSPYPGLAQFLQRFADADESGLLDEDGRLRTDLEEAWKTKGKRLSAEHRKKISDALKGRGKQKPVDPVKVGAKGSGTGKGALAKAHPVGSMIRTRHGRLKVVDHASGYIGVEGGKKKWYKLDELQGLATGQDRRAVKPGGLAVGSSSLKTRLKASPLLNPGSADSVRARHQKLVDDAWEESETGRENRRKEYQKWREKVMEDMKAKYGPSKMYGAPEYDAYLKESKQRELENDNLAAEAVRKYAKALDDRNMATYTADLKAGVKREKPVTQADIEAVAEVNLRHIDPNKETLTWHPDYRAVVEQVEKTGKSKLIAADDGTGHSKFVHVVGETQAGYRNSYGYAAPPSDPRGRGSPPEWDEATRKNGLMRELYEAREENLSLGEYRQKLDAQAQRMTEAAMQTGGVFIRATPATLAKVVTGDGFKTQHETQPNKETTQTRKEFEKMLFGYATDGSMGHPTYGYVSGNKDGRITQASIGGGKKAKTAGEESTDWLDGYGGAAVRLKPEAIRAFTTITHGDSADVVVSGQTSSARPLDRPDHTIFSRQVSGMTAYEKVRVARTHRPSLWEEGGVDGKFADQVSSWGNTGYMEAQFHGKVRAEHIAEAIFPQKPPAATIKALKQAGIPWRLSDE